MNLRKLLPFVPLALLAAGCNQSTDVSAAPSEAEVQAANKKRAASVEDRKDLTPEQKANMARYMGGGGAPSSGPSKKP